MHTLFPPLPFGVCSAMKALPRAINDILPLRTAHKRDLPLAVEELSLRLTSERSTLSRPYWSTPRLTSAYLRYFLPWNIIRLARLFAGLPLPAPQPLAWNEHAEDPSSEPIPRLLVDVGSGPLTLPIALWMAKPEWRDLPLTVLCIDAAPQPLDLGKKLFIALAGEHSPWRIITRRAPLDALPRELRHVRGVPWLLTAANVINEIPVKTGQFNDERFAAIAAVAANFCQSHDASALFVEPGTRLGGKNMVSLREQALEAGLYPIAPCPHAGLCPVQESRSWCHFTFDVNDAPAWLLELSRQAHLTKDGLSMAFMLLQKATEQNAAPEHAALAPKAGGNIEQVRIISAPFVIPGMWGSARYACSERGLVLLTDALTFPSGALVAAEWPDSPRQDKKSGAFIIAPHKPRGEVIMRSAPRKGQHRANTAESRAQRPEAAPKTRPQSTSKTNDTDKRPTERREKSEKLSKAEKLTRPKESRPRPPKTGQDKQPQRQEGTPKKRSKTSAR